MPDISRAEFNQRMDKMFKCMDTNHKEVTETVTEIRIDMAVIKTKVEAIVIPERPCDDVKGHILEHKETVDSWRKPVIVGIITLAIIFITKVVPGLISLLNGN